MKQGGGKKLKTSDVGPHGWHIWHGCQSLSLMSVGKKMSGKLISMHVFLGLSQYAFWKEVKFTSSEALVLNI